MSQRNVVQEAIRTYLTVYYEKMAQQDEHGYLIHHLFANTLEAQMQYKKQKKILNRQKASYAEIPYRMTQEIKEIKWKTIRFHKNNCFVSVKVILDLNIEASRVMRGSIQNDRQIKLIKIEGKWYIEEDSYIGEEDKGSSKEESLDKRRNSTKKQTKNKIRQKRESITKENQLPKKTEVKGVYNRQAAVDYAFKYAMKPNIQKWHNYEKWGGDCTNFVSQCLYAGGIPFDHIGDSPLKKWFWYSDAYRTPTWTSANAFKEYMLYNKGYGLVAKLARKEDMEIGDVVQLGTLERTTHSMIVVDILYKEGDNKEMIDLLVAQRSDEGGIHGVNIPLSLKPPQRLYYKIVGYNPQTF